jgi:hypothetical protein
MKKVFGLQLEESAYQAVMFASRKYECRPRDILDTIAADIRTRERVARNARPDY